MNMQIYKHNKWLSFKYPADWLTEYEEGQIIFEDKNSPVGALLFTVFYPPENEEVNLKEWLAEMLEIEPEKFEVSENKNWVRFQYVHSEERSWRYWAIKKDSMVLFGSYNCDPQDEGKEDQVVDAIIASIFE